MAFLVPKSEAALPLDSLPALVVRHWLCDGACPKTYTQARMCFLQDSLCIGFSVFEKAPGPTGFAALALCCNEGARLLVVKLNARKAEVYICQKQPVPDIWALLPGKAVLCVEVNDFSGEDETGPYWGGALQLPADILGSVGISSASSAFYAQLIKLCGGFGTSFPLAKSPLDTSAFGKCKIIPW